MRLRYAPGAKKVIQAFAERMRLTEAYAKKRYLMPRALEGKPGPLVIKEVDGKKTVESIKEKIYALLTVEDIRAIEDRIFNNFASELLHPKNDAPPENS